MAADPIVQILIEAAARGRELRRQREAAQQKETRSIAYASEDAAIDRADDSRTQNAPADSVSIAHE
jgi:hypothetical protein